jgi:plastocyanin
LPFTPGTNLVEKYLDVNVATNATTCSSPLTQGYAPGSFQSQQVTINGINFVNESGSNAGAGNIFNWVAYSILQGTNCISLGFTLHSTNPGNSPTPPPAFDMNAESAVFSNIVSSFVFTNAVPTPTMVMSNANVTISNFTFQPSSLQVHVGTTVTWTNNDSTAHTVTSDTSSFNSGTLAPGGTFAFTFTQAGTFSYHCNIHPSMHGTITVVP